MSEDLEHNPNPKIGAPPPDLPSVDAGYEPVKDLHYTRAVRGMIVKGLSGTGIPSDPKTLGLLMSTLKDMDSAALGQMRIKSEEKGQELQAQQQALVREYLSQSGGVRPPTRPDNGNPAAPPTLDDTVGSREFVPGELKQGTITSTFDEFAAARGGVELAATDAPD